MTPGEQGVCRWLRSRSAYGRELQEAAFETGESGLEGYWCLCTAEPVGPDDRLVHAQACRVGRACFAARAAGG